MRFWDTSAIVPLLLEQAASPTARTYLTEDDALAAWWGTPIECWSALARLRRDGVLTRNDEGAAADLLETLRGAWLEILPSEEVRNHARRLLRTHALRSADALQLGAALVWAGAPVSHEVVTFDARLAEAAHAEGFTVLGLEAESP